MQWFIITPAKEAALDLLNDDDRAVIPRDIDNPASPYFGKGALPASIVDAPGYERFASTIKNVTKFEGEVGELFLPTKE